MFSSRVGELVLGAALLLAAGCPGTADFDGDGADDSVDCGAADRQIFPGAAELCDDVDSDCDGSLVDEFDDLDSDGEPDCIDDDADGDGVSAGADCDDLDPALGAQGQDADCDGTLTADDCDDQDAGSTVQADDADCDGVLTDLDCNDRNPNHGARADDMDCDGVPTDPDCDDGNQFIGDMALDGDCDGTLTDDDCDDDDIGSTVKATDADCDTYLTADDCDDADPSIFPGAEEHCDLVDSDCDGSLADEDPDLDLDGLPNCVDPDVDGDGVAGALDCDELDATSTIIAEDNDCDGTLTGDDCDDTDPGSTIVAEDADCDGNLTAADCDDTDSSSTIVALDADCDGSLDTADCDDTDATVFPGAVELCDLIDSDCDGSVVDSFPDLDTDAIPDCVDDDADGDGVLAVSDCDDFEASTYPGAYEDCDAVDSDCDGEVVDGWPNLDGDLLPDCVDPDADGDGIAVPADCNDMAPAVFPGAVEVECDGIDNDCAVSTADDVDADADGVLCSLDCDDGDGFNYPGNTEVCDGQDNDCDPVTWAGDEGDGDGDGTPACGDCDDSDASAAPTLPETTCDGVDNDCAPGTPDDIDGDADGVLCSVDCDDFDGALGDQAADQDCDGVLTAADCDDLDPLVYPGSQEIWESPRLGRDTDCDGTIMDFVTEAEVETVGVLPGLSYGVMDLASGDFDGDGAEDFLSVGGRYWPPTEGYLLWGGTLALGLGPSTYANADVVLTSPLGSMSAPQLSSVGSVGDIDGDGLDDLLASGDNSGGPFLSVLPGSLLPTGGQVDFNSGTTSILLGGPLAALGFAGIGDIDGDGLGDIAVGVPTTVGPPGGLVHIFLGSTVVGATSLTLAQADATITQVPEGGQIGGSLTAAGDVNNDGFDDFVVTDTGYSFPSTATGRSYVFLGAASGWTGTRAVDTAEAIIEAALGTPISETLGAGDLDGDDFDDIVFPSVDLGPAGSGSSVRVFFGATIAPGGTFLASTADVTLVPAPSEFLSNVVAPAGDLDGDGLDDLIVGGSYISPPGTTDYDQKVSVFLGASMSPGSTIITSMADAVILSEGPYAGFGDTMTAGDVDGDGRSDLFLGAPGYTTGTGPIGKTYLLLSPL